MTAAIRSHKSPQLRARNRAHQPPTAAVMLDAHDKSPKVPSLHDKDLPRSAASLRALGSSR
jgi:hypothetical protein